MDTSAWYAAMDRSDKNHARATELLVEGAFRVITDHVLVETWRLAAHRLGWTVAEQFFDSVRRGVAQVEAVTAADREHAWATGQAFADQQFAFAARTSFAVMERLAIDEVLTFDHDFAVYRYGRDRRRAFVVIR